jgi:hypothetical protein
MTESMTMVHLRLVAGTDVTGTPRKSQRVQRFKATPLKPPLNLIPTTTAPEPARASRASSVARSRRQKDPVKLKEAEARAVLRSLTLPGDEGTLGELIDAATVQIRKRKLAGRNHWTPSFDKLYRRLHSFGITVSITLNCAPADAAARCEVISPDWLLLEYPACRPYESVLQFLELEERRS